MNHLPYLVSGLALLGLLLAWGIHYTAYQDGRLAGLVGADKRNRELIKEHLHDARWLALEESLGVARKLDASMAAVKHVLSVICDDPAVGYQLGHLTESYELLCQAVATHQGESLEKVKDRYRPAQYPAPNEASEAGAAYLMPQQARVARELNISPITAREVIGYARRNRIDLDEDDGRLAFARWADAKTRAFANHRAHAH